jgi:hypothetical protein
MHLSLSSPHQHPVCTFPSALPTNTLYTHLLSPVHATCLAQYPSPFYHQNNQVMAIPPPAPLTSSFGKLGVELQDSRSCNNPASRSIGYPPWNLEDTGFKSRPDISYYEAFSDQSQSFEANARMENQIRLKPLPSTSLAIHDSLTVHSFHNAAVPQQMSVS